MTAKEFVLNIRENQPQISNLQDRFDTESLYGVLSDAKISDLNSSYKDYGNEILNLIYNFDVSQLNVFDITFDPEPEVYEDYIFFGWDAIGDRLGYHIPSGEVVIYYVYGDCVNLKCAKTDEQFLRLFFELYLLLKGNIENEGQEAKTKIREQFWLKTTSTLPEAYWDHYKRFLTLP